MHERKDKLKLFYINIHKNLMSTRKVKIHIIKQNHYNVHLKSTHRLLAEVD